MTIIEFPAIAGGKKETPVVAAPDSESLSNAT